MSMHKNYRPEIDGLRGLSVLCVVLYHTGLPIFQKAIPGSFVALDIFFVISGYLIAQSIIARKDHFSFKRFYVRRVKRLFPSLFLTLFISMLVGFFLFPPGRVENLAKTGLYSLLCSSNFYFGTNTDYFSYEAASEVFLHTWSLSLEEQFYLLFPALLIFYLKRGPTFFKTTIIYFILALLGIGLAEVLLERRNISVYYLLPYRAHELMAGALICFLPNALKTKLIIKETLTWTGIVILSYSYLGLSHFDPYPGLNSIWPTLGTFFVLTFGQKTTAIKWAFNWRPIKAIGASCYGIYLFHWPIFVFFRYLSLGDGGLLEYLSLSAFSVSLGCLAWFKLEKRVIGLKANSKEEKTFLQLSLFSAVFFLIACAVIFYNQGFPSRYPRAISTPRSEIIKEREAYWHDVKKLFSKKPDILFIGNSHAVDLIYMFKENGLMASIDQIDTTFRCHHFIYPVRRWHKDFCEEKEKEVLEYPELSKVKRIYLHDYWWVFDKKRLEKFLIDLEKKGAGRIYLFGPKMAYNHSLIDVYQVSSARGESYASLSRKDQMSQRFSINEKAKNLVRSLTNRGINIEYIDLLELQCGANYSDCISLDQNGELLYFDDSHFNMRGAQKLGKILKHHRPDLFFAEGQR